MFVDGIFLLYVARNFAGFQQKSSHLKRKKIIKIIPLYKFQSSQEKKVTLEKQKKVSICTMNTHKMFMLLDIKWYQDTTEEDFTLHTLTSDSIFSTLFSIHFSWC